ncbi:tRNA lysidine(34) synthetase TilS [Luteimonas fraxinea]|uniref:tRNA lysidine(34) synthetase TilS n=1 Tax=Luteimonas fraxinea TaxID=2901869 RepID=UPI001E4E1133|nr:tRNA lysidine(34) synthetase TilS [Luteimonas fraxinea]MCD9127162.1 tRNA lysidine(34) synthetase TilS [Luteimonas fraxinea]
MPIDMPLPDLPPDARGRLVVGYSGGLDSSVLLHVFAHTPALRARGLHAVHVHHGLQAGADDWAGHCVATCERLEVPCSVVRVNVARDSGEGPEAAARAARHAAFAAQLEPGDVLALAHHRDDQAETVLLRALRASGPDGLSAMRPLRPFASGWLWRPLLALPRAQLLAYAQAHGLEWIEDPSNAVDDADRNFLRNRVMPLLRTRWPHADVALSTVAALQAETSGLLAAGDDMALATARTRDPSVLRLDALRALPVARRTRVLRRWIAELELPPLPARAIDWCNADLDTGRADRAPCFDWAGHRLQRWRGLLQAAPIRAPLDADFTAQWNGAAPLQLPDGGRLWLDGATDDRMWTVRAREGGERICLPGRAHTHALKHVLQSLGVPPWIRAQLPVLVDGEGRVLAAGDLAFDAGFDASLRDGDRRLYWSPPGDMHTVLDAPIA